MIQLAMGTELMVKTGKTDIPRKFHDFSINEEIHINVLECYVDA